MTQGRRGSFVPRYAFVSQKALLSRMVHHDPAFLTVHASRGFFGHGDFVFCSALAFMRPGEPFYEFGHVRNMRPDLPVIRPFALVANFFKRFGKLLVTGYLFARTFF